MRWIRWSVGTLTVVVMLAAAPSCSDDDETSTLSTTTTTTTAGGHGGAGGAGGAAGGAGGGLIPPEEVCDDGLDNDGDGTVDEDCPCTNDSTQQCYPGPDGPPDGCEWGEQTCSASAWGGCLGAKLPPIGEETCCTVIEGPPVHALYDAFVAAYPAANMPNTLAAVQAFAPVADGHAMAWSDLNVGGEYVDDTNGGVVAANINLGRADSRAQAELAMPAGSAIVWAKEDPPIIQAQGTNCDPQGGNQPGGVGWAWGSIVYQAPDESVGELVYLYIGFCEDGDAETFYYSDSPVVICKPPQVPR